MSITICQTCTRYIDSDDDPDCFIEQPDGEYLVRCDSCRDTEDSEDTQP